MATALDFDFGSAKIQAWQTSANVRKAMESASQYQQDRAKDARDGDEPYRSDAGYQKLTENTCQLCALNFYCAGADAVVSCPGNSTSARGASVINACTCIDGFFWWNNMCVLCSADYFCSNNTRIPCDANSTSLHGSVSIDNCTCLPGFH
jgi:hypothetical protein